MILRRVRAALVVACFALAACEKGAPKDVGVVRTPGGANPIRLGMVTDVGGLGDKSFNDSAYAGLHEAKTKLGAEIDVLQSRSAADYVPNLTVLTNEDFDEVFAIGNLMERDVAEIARDYPKHHFAIVDAVVNEPNVSSITFREQEGSFLAGALAAMMSKSHKLGFLGGTDIPLLRKFEAGFIAGAREIDPRTQVAVKYVGSFDDVAAGKELATLIYDGGADVLYVAAGKSGLGAIDETRARANVYAIGVDSDQDALAPGKILTSVLKRIDVAVFDIAEDTQSQKLPAGRNDFGLADGGVALTPFTYTKRAIGAARLARLATIRAAIVAHKIVPPYTREGLAAFKPVKL